MTTTPATITPAACAFPGAVGDGSGRVRFHVQDAIGTCRLTPTPCPPGFLTARFLTTAYSIAAALSGDEPTTATPPPVVPDPRSRTRHP